MYVEFKSYSGKYNSCNPKQKKYKKNQKQSKSFKTWHGNKSINGFRLKS